MNQYNVTCIIQISKKVSITSIDGRTEKKTNDK